MKRFAHRRLFAQQGFTVIELMTVLAIALILIMVGVPTMMDTIKRNSVSSKLNELLGAQQVARSEAVTRNGPVTFCIMDAADEEACDADGSLTDGWIVFSDPDGDAEIDADEVIIGSSSNPADQFQIDHNGNTSITYGAMGTTTAEVVISVCRDAEFAGELRVETTGRAAARKLDTCPP
jgi:type IV fimbrial biogenesis protein FimT